VRVGPAGAVEVRGADEQLGAGNGEGGAEVAAVLAHGETADRAVERGVARADRRRHDGAEEKARDGADEEARDERGDPASQLVARGIRGRHPQCFSFATASFISGTALKRSATRP
jgi:hypothetical protein